MRRIMKIKTLILLFMLIIIQSTIATDTILGKDEINDVYTGLIDSATGRISMIFPILLLVISIIAVMIDFGAIGVILGSMGSMIIITWLGLIVISTSSIISFLLLGSLLLYKVAS